MASLGCFVFRSKLHNEVGYPLIKINCESCSKYSGQFNMSFSEKRYLVNFCNLCPKLIVGHVYNLVANLEYPIPKWVFSEFGSHMLIVGHTANLMENLRYSIPK